MTNVIETVSNNSNRAIEVPVPEILNCTTIEALLGFVDENVVVKAFYDQAKIKFRALIRGKLDAQTDGQQTNSDEDILAEDHSDWKPEARTRKTAEEKAMDSLGKLDPAQLEAVLAALEKQKEEDGSEDTESPVDEIRESDGLISQPE